MHDQGKVGPKPGKPQALGELDHRIIATVREPLIVLDGDLRVISANDSFYRTFEVLPPETEGRLLFEVGNRQWNIPRLRILLENILPANQHFDDFEVEHDFPEIGRRSMLLNARRLTGEGTKDLILLAIEDVTERKDLERRVQEQTAELEASNQELESFTSSVAYDLKANIRAIEGFSRMLIGEHADKLDEEALRLLQVICTNTASMTHFIEDLMGIARLTRQPMRKTDINLGDMARQVFERLQSQEPGRNLQLTVHDLPTAYADHSLLYQVMLNILGNAIKCTSSRDIAVIEVGGMTEGNEKIYYVKDNGAGFDDRYIGNPFSPFQRRHLCAEYEGTGIGLAIVQRIIKKHGGRVWAEGKVNEGATFYFALPKE